MRRRGFFGFAAGAVVAGPAVAKDIAAKTFADDAVLHGLDAMGIRAMPFPSNGPVAEAGAPLSPARALNTLSLLRTLTGEQRRELLRRQYVSRLDPDIASYRSFSMSAKLAMQRERQLEEQLATRKGWAERLLLGQTFSELDDL